ncbi:MAG: 30S ribosomal protein S2 [Candidatus Omnitrophota bacterium]
MATELLKQLLAAGVHFGHQKKRWNPKMKDYVFGEKSGIYIIDLEKTVISLNKARVFLEDLAASGSKVLLVGTKRQAQDIIREAAKKANMFYIDQRWVGGMMTNFKTIKKSINRYKEIKKMQADGLFEVLAKKEVSSLTKEMERLRRSFAGILDMENLPSAIYVVDPNKEKTAIFEARRLKIPVVALIDTNCNPEGIDYPIPGNDDAIKSIQTITSLVSDSLVAGRKRFLDNLQVKEEIRVKAQEEKEGAVELKPIELDVKLEKLETEVLEEAKPAKAKPHVKKVNPKSKEEV